MMNYPTGTITFLFTDIEGSTTFWERHPDAMRVALARHDALLRQAITGAGGVVFKTVGDAFCAAFATAPEAVCAALSAQTALFAEPWPAPIPLRSRMGLHTGTAELRDNDYFGPALNRVARLMAAGHGGQVLLSDATHELSRDALPLDATLTPLGEHRLKDLIRAETIYQLTHPSLPADFPPLRTLDNPETPNNLPQQTTSFIGREAAIADVRSLLGKTRLLTLTGSGGSGKTRLSLQAAAEVLEQYPDGVWQAELAALTDPALVPQTVAAAVGVREQPGQTVTQTLTDALKPKRLLLMLDNCEHLLGACATLIAALLRACPNVKVLTTSREPLGIAGEQTYRVPTLTLPSVSQTKAATPESLSQFESVRLFIERSQAVKPDFAVTNQTAPALAQICYRLDGIPLAIELAAARVRSLPIEQMLDKLDNRFRLLTGGDRSALPRQQTLRALIDWSYDLLSETEKTLLARLSIFAGGWTLDAAESICGFDPIEDWEALDLLTSLADKSLVLAEEHTGPEDQKTAVRYRMLETVRQYAGEKMAASGEFEDTTARHLRFFVALAEEAAPLLRSAEQVVWLNRLEREHDNFRASLDSCVQGAASEANDPAAAARNGLRLVGTLWFFWYVRGYISEGREQASRAIAAWQRVSGRGQSAYDGAADTAVPRAIWARKEAADALRAGGILALAQSDHAAARQLQEESLSLYRQIDDRRGITSTLGNLGNVAFGQGDHAAARSLYEESLSLYRQIDDKPSIALSLCNLGDVAFAQGDYGAARALCDESLSLYRQIGDKIGIARASVNLGASAFVQGDHEAAQSFYEESLSLCREIGNKRGVAGALGNLGSIASARNDYATARSLQEESLNLRHEIGDKRGITYGLSGMAAVCVGEGDVYRAVVLWAASDTLRESVGEPSPLSDRAEQNAALASARASLGDVAFDAAWAEGVVLSWEQVLNRARNSR